MTMTMQSFPHLLLNSMSSSRQQSLGANARRALSLETIQSDHSNDDQHRSPEPVAVQLAATSAARNRRATTCTASYLSSSPDEIASSYPPSSSMRTLKSFLMQDGDAEPTTTTSHGANENAHPPTRNSINASSSSASSRHHRSNSRSNGGSTESSHQHATLTSTGTSTRTSEMRARLVREKQQQQRHTFLFGTPRSSSSSSRRRSQTTSAAAKSQSSARTASVGQPETVVAADGGGDALRSRSRSATVVRINEGENIVYRRDDDDDEDEGFDNSSNVVNNKQQMRQKDVAVFGSSSSQQNDGIRLCEWMLHADDDDEQEQRTSLGVADRAVNKPSWTSSPSTFSPSGCAASSSPSHNKRNLSIFSNATIASSPNPKKASSSWTVAPSSSPRTEIDAKADHHQHRQKLSFALHRDPVTGGIVTNSTNSIHADDDDGAHQRFARSGSPLPTARYLSSPFNNSPRFTDEHPGDDDGDDDRSGADGSSSALRRVKEILDREVKLREERGMGVPSFFSGPARWASERV